jgi:hypothetical protein
MKDAQPFAKALQEKLAGLGIRPPMECDQQGVVISRQALGDVEYLFATNATPDEKPDDRLAIKPAIATLSLPNDGRPIYDAIRGKSATEFTAKGKSLSAKIRFGAGQMRVFARTARPIGAVQVSSPIVSRDYTQPDHPLHAELVAFVNDTGGKTLVGSIPLRIVVTDPLGATRYGLFRATDKGICPIDLPLAANDPPGEWKVSVHELLNDTEGGAAFNLVSPASVGAIAGARERAMIFGNDSENIHRFFHTFEDVTIVAGNGDYSAAIARIVTSLKPWDVRCKVVPVAEVSKPRALSPEESATWVGLIGGVKQNQKESPPPEAVGFAVQGPVILLGTPEDHPLIKFAVDHKFLPYTPDAKALPGRARGMVAWQRDLVGYQQQSITLIGYDAAGIAEAIGTMYESLAGQEPLMPLAPPTRASVTPAKQSPQLASLHETWRASLPDRAVSMKVEGNALRIATADGSKFTIDASGHVGAREDSADSRIDPKNVAPTLADAAAKSAPLGLLPKAAATREQTTAVAYWGGTVCLFDSAGKLRSKTSFAQDVAEMAWLGDQLVLALADGKVISVKQ